MSDSVRTAAFAYVEQHQPYVRCARCGVCRPQHALQSDGTCVDVEWCARWSVPPLQRIKGRKDRKRPM